MDITEGVRNEEVGTYANKGFHPDAEIVTVTANTRKNEESHCNSENMSVGSRLRIRNRLVREFLAECLGTFVLMVFGNGSVAQTVLSNGADGNFLTIYWAYGIGVTMGVYIAGGVSGAHLNPAVSVSMSALGKLPWKKLPVFVTAQLLGAFLSGPVVYGIYYDALNEYDGGTRYVSGVNQTASIFATYPKDYLSISNGFFDQVFATAVLLGGILAITDEKNNKPPAGMEPLLVGLLVFALGNSYGTNCGYAINPARDLGPRIFTAIAGWGGEVFTAPDGAYWFWVPIVAPILGGLIGSFVYEMMIGLHLPSRDTTNRSGDEYYSQMREIDRDCSDLIVSGKRSGNSSAL